MGFVLGRFPFFFLNLVFSFILFDCHSFSVQEDLEFIGFRVLVYYEGKTQEYKLPEQKPQMDLLEIFARMSAMESPPMRFITTNNSVEIYEVDGIRNSNAKEWAVYVDKKWISGESLKKGVVVPQNAKIEILYLKAVRIPLPRSSNTQKE